LAERRSGGPGDEKAFREDEEEPELFEERGGASEQGDFAVEERGEVDAQGKDSTTIDLETAARRSNINPDRKRNEYLEKLELMIRELENMNANPSLIDSKKLKAMDVAIRAVRMCYNIVRDVDVEEIEAELEKIKEATEEESDEEFEEADFAPLDAEDPK
jgi:hypothetical protein